MLVPLNCPFEGNLYCYNTRTHSYYRQRYVPMDPRKIKYWAHNRPHNPMTIEKSKPLLTLKRPSHNADTIELSTSLQASPPSSGSHGNTDETWFHGEEGEHDDVEYTALREELLGEL